MWHHEYIDKYVDTLVFDPAENTVSWVLDGICAADSISDPFFGHSRIGGA